MIEADRTEPGSEPATRTRGELDRPAGISSGGFAARIPSDSGTFPTAYSLSRPELQNNPGALVAGDDWQNYSSSAEVAAEFTHEQHWGTNPVQCGTVNLVADGVFGQVPQGQHNDGSTSCKPNEVRYDQRFTGVDRAWIRVLWKAEANYEYDSFWKFIWSGVEADGGSGIRHLEWYNGTGGFAIAFHTQGGTECGDGPNDSCITLDASRVPDARASNHMARPVSAVTDQEWWEFIICQEALRGAGTGGGDVYRVRMWKRAASTGQGATLVTASGPGDFSHKIGLESDGANILTDFINRITLGRNRNDPTSPGHTNYFRWGPWEVIDADVIADPYGLAADMLRF